MTHRTRRNAAHTSARHRPGPGRSRPGGTARDPGEFVAALPSLLGFHPEASLVIAGLGGSAREVGLVMRCGLPPEAPPDGGPPRSQLHAFVAHLVTTLQRSRPSSAIVAVVDDRPVAGAAGFDIGDPPDPLPWPELVAVVSDQLEAAGVPVHTAVWAAGCRAGAGWACYHPCRCSGTIPAEAAASFAAGAAFGGTVVHAARDELARIVEPIDAQVLQRRERMIEHEIDSLAGAALPSSPTIETPPPAATALSAVSDALADAVAGRLVLDDRRVVELAVALGDPVVRAAAVQHLALLTPSRTDGGSGPDAERERAGAEQLWAALARETPAPEAAEPAALLAVSALLRGDGALANVALDRATEAWPGHLFSRQLRAAASLGLRPDQLREALLSRSDEEG